MNKRVPFTEQDEDAVDSVFHWRRKYNEAVDKWIRLDSTLIKVIRENDALRAELETYNPIGTVAGGATERTFMHPSVKFILPTGLQLYARIEVREEDKV
jgi:hypothetical protein